MGPRNMIILFLLGFGLLLIFGVTLFSIQLSSKEKLLREAESLTFENEQLIRMIDLQIQSPNACFLPDYELTDVNGKVLYWRDFEWRDKLIFRFSNSNCMTCVKAQVPFLKKVNEELGGDKVVLLVSYDNRREMITMLKTLGLNMRAYNIKRQEFSKDNEALENLGLPYLIETGKSGQYSRVFVPIKELPKVSLQYYNRILGLIDNK